MSQDKTVSWQIPRVSLNGSSSSSGSESLRHARRNSAPSHESGSQELKYFSKSLEMKNAQGNLKKLEPDKRRMSCDNNLPGRKRGSHSSQGSSNNSTFSTSSLQLTVANLENFAKSQEAISRSQSSHRTPMPNYHRNDVFYQEHPSVISGELVKEHTTIPIVDHHQNLLMNFQNFNIFSEKDFTLPKIKDYDEETSSIASSTHFTMVNGFGTPSRFKEPEHSRLCSRTNQITVLIITMTIIFIIFIIFIVCMMEMRAQKMTDMEMSLKT